MLLHGGLSEPIQLQLIVFAKPRYKKYQDNHEQANKMRQCEGNGFSTCLEGFCALVHTKLSKQVEKPFPSCWHFLLACSWLSLYFLYHGKNETKTKKTKRRRICKGNPAKKHRKVGYCRSNGTASHPKSPHSSNSEQIVLRRYVL